MKGNGRVLKGRCNCGAVSFIVEGDVQGASVCHCSQCRRQSGHTWASAHAPVSAVKISGAPRWYHTSETARRGFCTTCGSFLFWKAHDEDRMSFALGALEAPTGITLEKHIFTADKGDYYEIADGVPQRP
nr:GFA family protein [Mesobacterium pallidum]